MHISSDRLADLTAFASRSANCKGKQAEIAIGSNAASLDIPAIKVKSNCGEPGGDVDLQLEKLTKQWGQAGSPFDVDGNGAVDVADLQSMVSGWAQAVDASSGTPAAEAISSAAPSAPQSTTMNMVQNISDIVANWGQPGTSFDINGDGTVNVQDLLQAIQMLSQSQGAAPAATSSVATDTADATAPVAAAELAETPTPAQTETVQAAEVLSPAQPTPEAVPVTGPMQGPHAVLNITQLVAQWGQSGTSMDINGDGMVNTADLLQLIAQIGGSNSPGGGEAAPAGAPPVADLAESRVGESVKPETLSGLTDGRMHKLSKAFIERLTAAGYADAPPTNIRDLVAKLNLMPADNQRLLAALQKQYPEGLGVNLRA